MILFVAVAEIISQSCLIRCLLIQLDYSSKVTDSLASVRLHAHREDIYSVSLHYVSAVPCSSLMCRANCPLWLDQMDV